MARVLFLTRDLEGGGAERQLLLLSAGLRRRGHDVTIAVYYRGGFYEAEVEATGVQYVSLEKRGFWDLAGFFRRTLRLVRSLQPDVVHGYMDVGNCVALAVKPFLPRSRIAWGMRASGYDMMAYDVPGRLLRRMLMVGSRWTDVIICNSQSGARHVSAHGYPPSKVVVIPNGFDTDRFRPDPAARERLRAEWGIGPEQPIIGLAARLDPMKDHATFVAAARLMLEKVPNARFVCAGDWVEPYRTKVLEVLGGSGLGERLKWYSYVRDMPSFYNALDVSTSSSAFGEGVSNAVAESMACGIPCVVTDVGDSRLLVGQWGIVVPPRDPQALADGWCEQLHRRGPELAAACRQHIVQGYSVEALIDRTERALGLVPAA